MTLRPPTDCRAQFIFIRKVWISGSPAQIVASRAGGGFGGGYQTSVASSSSMSQCLTSRALSFSSTNVAFELAPQAPASTINCARWTAFIRLNALLWFHPFLWDELSHFHNEGMGVRKHWLDWIGFYANVSLAFNKSTCYSKDGWWWEKRHLLSHVKKWDKSRQT